MVLAAATSLRVSSGELAIRRLGTWAATTATTVSEL
jgi:hypothetical protein